MSLPPQLSDHPTDEELREYLMRSIRMSAFAWAVDNSEFDPERLDAEYVATLTSLSRVGIHAFLTRVVEALYDQLKRLNDVPRDDPFWTNSTLRPTLYKLRDFNAGLYQKNPDDIGTLWAQAAMYLVHGSSNFGAKQWRRLHYNKTFDISWPILAALITELHADPTGNALVELIDRIEMIDEANVFLATLDAAGDPWVTAWRDAVREALNS